jgi:HEAT repeat protein
MRNKPSAINGLPVPYGAAVADLMHRIDTMPHMQAAAFAALAYSSDPASIDAILAYIDSTDWTVRRIALEALGHHEQAHLFEQKIVGCLADPCEYVVRTACQSVEDLGLHSAHERLLFLLRHPQETTRECAVRALKSIWQSADFGLVLNCFRHDPSVSVRKDAAWTLVHNVTAENWQVLFDIWKSDPISRHRVFACEIAQKFSGTDCLDALHALAVDPDGHVRKAAEQAIEILGSYR